LRTLWAPDSAAVLAARISPASQAPHTPAASAPARSHPKGACVPLATFLRRLCATGSLLPSIHSYFAQLS